MTLIPAVSYPISSLQNSIVAPGDKSCSHRSIIMGAIAKGTTRISGLLESDDIAATRNAMTALGANCRKTGTKQWEISSPEQYNSPPEPLDMGNSGTSARLLMGIVASLGLNAHFVGDNSLSKRPMERVLIPLRRMGAICNSSNGTLPVKIHAPMPLAGITHTQIHASAQVKSAILLAGLAARGTTTVIEPTRTRDHTETMLKAFGGNVACYTSESGYTASVTGEQTLAATEIDIPGDPSSAAFVWGAALVSPKAQIVVHNVMDHPDRSGLTKTALNMGAQLETHNPSNHSGINTVSLQAQNSQLEATSPESAASMIDEFPLFAVFAAYAKGTSIVRGASELRHKESDRIATTIAMLRQNGVQADEFDDGFAVHGCAGPPPGGGMVKTHGDHRIAMSAMVLGCGAQHPVAVDDASAIKTSYPGFFEDMASVGADIRS